MEKIIRRVLFLILLLLFGAASAAQTTKTTKTANTLPTPDADKTSIIATNGGGSCANPSPSDISFVITAQQGQLTLLPNGQFLLQLQGVGPYMTYYTRRPCYNSGLAATANFIRAWGLGTNAFSKNNPTGVLTFSMIDGVINKSTQLKILRFSKPDYNFGNSTMRFVVSPVGKNNQIIIKNSRYRHVALTIN